MLIRVDVTFYLANRLSIMKLNWYSEKATILAAQIVMFFAAVLLVPESAYAGISMGSVMCNAAYIVSGQVAAGVASIGICTLGAGACFGRVSWSMVAAVGAGCSAMFGAIHFAGLYAQAMHNGYC